MKAKQNLEKEIKSSIEKVSRDEFIVLEKRVMMLEKKSAHKK